jgi:hypothetical protein
MDDVGRNSIKISGGCAAAAPKKYIEKGAAFLF